MRFSLRWITLFGILLCSPVAAHAQSEASTAAPPLTARNLIQGELLGAGGLYSLNYERRFARRWTARVGFSALSVQPQDAADESITLVLLPVMVNGLVPGGTHNLELGAGPVFGFASVKTDEYGALDGLGVANFSANIAYRYHPPSGGFSFRAGLLPNYSGDSVNLWLAFGVGYAF